MKHFTIGALALCSLLSFGSCATIITGTRASININGQQEEPVNIVTPTRTYEQVMLPYIIKVPKRKLEEKISVTSEHYIYRDFIPGRKMCGWVWGNLAIGGLIGLGIDVISGGAYATETKAIDLNATPKAQPDSLIQTRETSL